MLRPRGHAPRRRERAGEYDAGDAPIVENVPGIAQLPSGLTRGFRYSVWSEAPQPTAAQLERSKPSIRRSLAEPGTFLDLWTRASPRLRSASQRGSCAPSSSATCRSRRRQMASPGAPVRRTQRRRLSCVVQDDRRLRLHRPPAEQWIAAPLVDFVTRTHAGYCQHFAGAMALMLRYLGVPARVAVGFSSGVYDAKNGVWRVTDHDAHAWVEVWFRGYGWLPFDPTPAAPSGARAAERALCGGGRRRCVRIRNERPRRRGRSDRPAPGRPPSRRDGGHGRSRCGLASAQSARELARQPVAAAGAASWWCPRRRSSSRRSRVRRGRYLTRDPRRLAGSLPAGARRLSRSTRTSTLRAAQRCMSSARSFATSLRSRRMHSSPPPRLRGSVRLRAPPARRTTPGASCGRSPALCVRVCVRAIVSRGLVSLRSFGFAA